MELRHLRYFVAVADAGSLTVAAEESLHTSQPSLSRQIRDLEDEVGAQLLTRSTHGIELTPAGRAFLDHARLVLAQVAAAGEAARRVAHPAKPSFVMGFLTGHELTWMPEALQVLRDELPNVDVVISSNYSPRLADALSKGKVDAAFLRREEGTSDLAYELLVKEPLGGPPCHGDVPNSVDARRRALTCLRKELSPFVCNESSAHGRGTNN